MPNEDEGNKNEVTAWEEAQFALPIPDVNDEQITALLGKAISPSTQFATWHERAWISHYRGVDLLIIDEGTSWCDIIGARGVNAEAALFALRSLV